MRRPNSLPRNEAAEVLKALEAISNREFSPIMFWDESGLCCLDLLDVKNCVNDSACMRTK